MCLVTYGGAKVNFPLRTLNKFKSFFCVSYRVGKTCVFYKKNPTTEFLNETRVLLGFRVFGFFRYFKKRKKNQKSFIWKFKDDMLVIMFPYDDNSSHSVV